MSERQDRSRTTKLPGALSIMLGSRLNVYARHARASKLRTHDGRVDDRRYQGAPATARWLAKTKAIVLHK